MITRTRRLITWTTCAGLLAGASPSWAQTSSPRPAVERQRSTKEVVLAVARHQLQPLADGEYRQGTWEEVRASREPQGISWVYPWGVTLLGLLRTSEVTGDRQYADFVIRHNEILGRQFKYLRWIRTAFGESNAAEARALLRATTIYRLLDLGSLDNAGAMSAQMVESALRHGAQLTPEEKEILGLTTAWVSTGQARLPDGTFWRPQMKQTLWVDDLFMSCSLLTRWYEHTKDAKYIDDAARQVIGMAGRQQDADGLWFHANFVSEGKTSPYKWGRANGWAIVATVEVLSVLPEKHPDRAKLLDILKRHVTGLKKVQAPSGMWRQVLDHPELWEENSCTSMFTFAIARAVRRRWLDKADLRVAQRAFAGIAHNVSAEGQVAGTSEGTRIIGRDLEYYANRPRTVDDWHSPGPVLLAGTELMAAEQSKH